MLISFVIPCYRSQNTLPQVVSTIQETVKTRKEFDSEIILVNDASPDDTWGTIRQLCAEYDNVRGVNLAKNSGQQAAIMAGLRHTKGELVAVSDDDGQTPIETVFEFYDHMVEGDYDVVCAEYQDRGKRSLFRRLGSWADNTMMRMFVDTPEGIRLSVYFLAKRFVVDEIVKYHNAFPHMEGLLIRTTLNIGNVKVNQKERASGSSGYNLKKLLTTWVNGLTTFSIKPLRIAVILGMLMALIGFIIIIALVIIKLTGPKMAHGWTSLVAINVLIGGMIMIMLGVIGEYVGRIYQCLNQNPQYVVRETINYESSKE
ncbi:MAG: glycosyltransferase family 2 protein [Lachnospiraceae bacterium]|nr:glycosyltransferase family 2 protein [Lachnospiraceae bacterium]